MSDGCQCKFCTTWFYVIAHVGFAVSFLVIALAAAWRLTGGKP